MTSTGYAPGNSINPGVGGDVSEKSGQYWPLSRCRKAYLDYLGNKRDEIEEQKNSRRYYHASQWTEAQIKALNKRNQPVVTFNRVGRKIDGVVGLIERLRQDPKAYPRTPKHEDGAELATASLRYVLDAEEWKAKSPICARDGAVDAIGGLELEIIQGDQGDNEIGFDVVEPDSFFYDPRSFRADFSDARYMGVGKWMDIDAATEMFPDKEQELKNAGESNGSDLTSNPDRENKFFSESGGRRLIRVIDIWYKHKGEWCFTLFTGITILMEGKSYLLDEKNKTQCRYIMFSGNVDQDGDRYGFVRNMKSAQDEYNSRRSKALHILNSRRLFISHGAVEDVEVVRREYAKPDGVILVPGNNVSEGVKAEDQSFDFAGQMKMMENAVAELENYGPNQALVGDSQNQSGRAIQLLQQAGMAELGPYIAAYRGWKIRVYRAIWNAIQRHWTGERWVRVTDNDGLAQFIQINGTGIDPQTGMPVIVNAIGSLDVDIILDEGADTINEQADVYETLSQVLPSVAPMLSPPEARAAVKILLNASALPPSAKKEFRDAAAQAAQPNPMAQQAQQLELADKNATVQEKQSKARLNMAKAATEGVPDQAAPAKPMQMELPMDVQIAQAAADINQKNATATDKYASAEHKKMMAFQTHVETLLAPHEMAQASFESAAQRAHEAEMAKRAAAARTSS